MATAYIRRLINQVSVEEKNQKIIISGVRTKTLSRDIQSLWKTSKINSYLFSKITHSALEFPYFFAPEVVYAIDQLLAYRNRRSNIRLLKSMRDKIMQNTWMAKTTQEPTQRLDYSRISKAMTLSPLDYQERFLTNYDRYTQRYELDGFLLSAAAGSGKTFISTALMEGLNKKRVFVICPARALGDPWQESLTTTKLFKTPQKAWFSNSGKPPKGDERFFVFHYEYLEKAFELLKIRPNDDTGIILDESHNMNEIVSLRTQLFIKFCQESNSQDNLLMSGTPIKALGSEAVPLFRVIDAKFDSDAEERFKKIFGRSASKGLDIIKNRLGLVSYKVEKSQLKLQKPIFHEMKVAIPNGKRFSLPAVKEDMRNFIQERQKYYKQHYKAYKKFFDETIETYRKQHPKKPDQQEVDEYLRAVKRLSVAFTPGALKEDMLFCTRFERDKLLPTLNSENTKRFKDTRSVIKYVQLKIQGEALGRVLGRKRIECHVAMVPYVDVRDVTDSTEKKTVLFTSYVEVIEALEKELPNKDLAPLTVYGKTTKDLAQTLEYFRNDEDANPLLATYQSLSTAVPLVMADRAIMFNSPFRSHDYEQAVSRIHRLDADTQTEIYNVVLDTGNDANLSTRNLDILAWSTQQVQMITGVKSPFDLTTTSLEGFGEASYQTDSDVLLQHLRRHFDPLGIRIAEESFDVNTVIQDRSDVLALW